ncbi:MAG: arsenate reductase (glutaredoxin) [Myxococcota bacterium]|nr:arsenate reductase (glutaredoxin) [Myxococcota bacterium]
MAITIYHNPRCSKSRETLQLLRDQGIEPQIVEYLKTGLAELEIHDLAKALACSLHELLRCKEVAYAELGLSDDSSDSTIVTALQNTPVLLERPIVISDKGAAVGRPPESVLALLS